jgi:hypothetical protein
MTARAEPTRVEASVAVDPRRIAPTLLAAVLGAIYVLASPPSFDLAAHLFRAQLFRMEGFGIWNNLWYSGHHDVSYSVLFPPVSAWLSPQLAAALAATGTAALFESLAHRHFGPDALLGSLVFAAATATNLFTGRLPFAFGALPAMAAVVALDRRRPWVASALALLSAACSPVAALFAALAGAAFAIGSLRRARQVRAALPGIAVAVAALAPLGLLAIAFPEGGNEPFAFSAMWPIPLLAIAALSVLPREAVILRTGVVLYALGVIASYLVPTAVGSNAVRLGTLIAAPLAALVWWPRRIVLLALAALPLLYVEWHDSVRDLATATGTPYTTAGYYQPLLQFLARQAGPPFRVEIPFTAFHWEAYAVATRFPLARGWERQLDIAENPIFYGEPLGATTYEAWLRRNAIRFVAAADAPLDYSAKAEMALIDRGVPYLHLVLRTAHWRVFEVADATPIAEGAATLTAIGANSVTLRANRAGTTLLRVRFTPYWALAQGAGCVQPAGDFTLLRLDRPGPVRLAIRFSLGRIGARSPRCTG